MITVRPLIWFGAEEWGWFKADAAFGRWYFVTYDPTDDEPPIVLRSDWLGVPELRYDTFAAAKSAIQSMFSRSILEQLEPHP